MEVKPNVASKTSDSTTSQSNIQTASVYTYGRRFQAYKDCAYILPNDDAGL
jgi:hypothetical protein